MFKVYETDQKLALDVDSIQVSAVDFSDAVQKITPAAQVASHMEHWVIESKRSIIPVSRRLSDLIKPLLEAQFRDSLLLLQKAMPSMYFKRLSYDSFQKEPISMD